MDHYFASLARFHAHAHSLSLQMAPSRRLFDVRGCSTCSTVRAASSEASEATTVTATRSDNAIIGH